MKIIAWNCRSNFKSKADYILLQKPDILIVPECEKCELETFKNISPNPTFVVWYGDNVKKGLGVLCFSEYKIEVLEIHNSSFKYILPLKVSYKTISLLLLAVWTHRPYVNQLMNAIDYYKDQITQNVTIIAGDFNSNSIWDKQNKAFSHSNLVKKLETHNIFSTYHHFYSESQGDETIMTHNHSSTKLPFHIDYCFVSKSLLDKLTNVEVGEIRHSDHAPIAVTFKP